ncbi:MAG: DUF4243 domain-containing protein [Planctomycetes bacterium]|nr:DUF4243 domain-containing protein [Planctomycetota bacterium]
MHAAIPPENPGGANHYPMAAEVLHELAPGAPLPGDWFDGVRYYDEPLSRRAPIGVPADALGDIGRHGDWLDHFRGELRAPDWRTVLSRWTPRLAPGLSGATFHGLIRTAHAVRALQRRDTPERRLELAAGLAYWASRFVELPVTATPRSAPDSIRNLAQTEAHALDDEEPGFHQVMDRLLANSLADPVQPAAAAASPHRVLQSLVLATTTALLEMLVQERNRIWLLHNVTGPAAVGLLLPVVDPPTARDLVAYAQQAAIAFHRGYGAPFVPEASVRRRLRPWSELTAIAVERLSVHGLKLFDALRRFSGDARSDRVARSTAEQWLEWV